MENENIIKLIDESIVIKDGVEGGVGVDLSEMSKEMTSDRNVFRFSRYNSYIIFYDSLLQAIRDKPMYNLFYGETKEKIKSRYAFIDRFLYHYHIGLGAIKGRAVERFTELASGLIGYNSMLEYRKAGIPDQENQAKKSIVDRLKR